MSTIPQTSQQITASIEQALLTLASDPCRPDRAAREVSEILRRAVWSGASDEQRSYARAEVARLAAEMAAECSGSTSACLAAIAVAAR